MKLYKALVANSYSYKDVAICVLSENENKTDIQGFLEMQEYVKSQLGREILYSNPETLSVVDTAKRFYILSHRRDVVNGILTCKPGTITQHVFSRDFTCETVYYDDNDELVDITGTGIDNIKNRKLIPKMDFEANIYTNPDVLFKTIYLGIRGMSFGDKTTRGLQNFDHNHIPKIGKSHYVDTLVNKHFSEFMQYLDSFSHVKKYLFEVCNFKVKAIFENA